MRFLRSGSWGSVKLGIKPNRTLLQWTRRRVHDSGTKSAHLDPSSAVTSTASTSGTQSLYPSPASLFDAIFIINLDHRTDRMDFMKKQLIDCGILPTYASSVHRYSAVNGKVMDPAALEKAGFISRLGRLRLEAPEPQKIWGMDLNGGGVGCALSHIELWAHISLHGYRRALVIEDDSLIPSTFLTDYAERMKSVPTTVRLPPLQSNRGSPASQESLIFKTDAPDDDCWDLIYVSGLDTARKGHLLLTDQPGFRYVHQAHRTTNCYLTHARGCDRLLESCVPLSYQLDTQMTLQCAPHPDSGELYVVEPRCFTMYPPLVVQATRFGSDIQTDNPGSNPAAEEKARMEEAGWNLPSSSSSP